MKKPTLVIVAVGALLLAYVTLRPNDSRSKSASAGDASAELERLRNDVRSLRNGLGHVRSMQRSNRRRQSSPSTETQTESSATSDGDTSNADPTETPRRPGNEILAEQTTTLETTMASDNDPTWTGWAENKLANVITAETVANSRSIAIKCASSVCRVTMEFDSAEHSMSAMQKLPTLVPWQANGFFVTDPQTHTATVYVSREGENLPRADQPS